MRSAERVRCRPAPCRTRSFVPSCVTSPGWASKTPPCAPSRVGSTRYLLMQDIPWFGKRDLKREIAELEADGAKGRAWAPGPI